MLLNFSQKKAINTIYGPCLVLAGAGSGKTTVIINKIIQLINVYKYRLKEIFAITFTNKAALKMKERIKKKISLKNNIQDLNIFTFHSLGMKIIKNEFSILKYKNNYSLFNRSDQLNLIKKILFENGIKEENFFFKKILLYISSQKNNLIRPKKAYKNATSKMDKQFSKYYKIYNNYLKKYNIFDFDDLIYIPIILFKNYPSVLFKWQNYIKYLLVDEYQDTNYLQYQFIKFLTSKNLNFTLVGDDNQSIYSWRGANSDNIFLLRKDYPTLKIIKMEHNYRSSQRILKVANHLISQNPHFLKKELFSNLNYGVKIEILNFKNEYQEAEIIVENILLDKINNFRNYKDYAILYRNNYQAKIFEKFLIKKNIPYTIHGRISFFQKTEIKNLIYYLKFIINQNDDFTFLKILNVPSRRIGKVTIQKIRECAKKKNKSYYNVIIDADFKEKISKNTFLKLKKFFLWIKEIKKFYQHYPLKLLKKIIFDIKYRKWLLYNIDKKKNIESITNNINILSRWINNILKSNKDISNNTLLDVINQLTLYDMNTEINNNKNIPLDKIQLMTIHSSKGLEFNLIFLIGVEEGILPHYKNLDHNIYEERRLMYVGITRAKQKLILSYCNTRYCYGHIKYVQPSRFLFELPNKHIKWKKLF